MKFIIQVFAGNDVWVRSITYPKIYDKIEADKILHHIIFYVPGHREKAYFRAVVHQG